MQLQLRSRAGRPARLIGGIVGAAILLTGGGTLAATSQARPQAATSGVTMDQAEAFVGVTPTRVLDTRQIGQTRFNPGETRTLSFGAHVPPEATSVALALVSPQGATALGYFTMWPTGQQRPETSVLNPVPSYDLATSALLRLGSGHGVDIYNAFGQSDIVVDLLGYFVPLSDVEGLGGGSNFLVGSGAPASTLGEDGDVYYDTVNKIFYGPKANGDWGDGSSAAGPTGPQGPAGPQGAAGAAGSQFLSGAVAPTTQGANGDFYLNTATGELYGPKTGGLWGSPTDLTGAAGADGADGSQILSGAGVPASGLGVDGDFYFDTTNDTFYGPKTAGAWGAGTSVQGPAGTMGPGTQVYGDGIGLVALVASQDIVFSDTRSYGGGVGGYNATNGQLTVTDAGTYRVSYTAESTASLLSSVAVQLDGVTVPGSSSGGLAVVATYNGEALIPVSAGDVLTLHYTGVLALGATLNASMIVEKVA